MSLRLKAGIFCLCAFSFSPAQADTIHFKDGRSLEGIVKAKKNDSIEVEVSGGVVKYHRDGIAWIVESTDGVRRQLREKWLSHKAGGEKSAGTKYQGEDSRPKEVKFIPGQQGMAVQATLNGKINVKLILDTGASLVVLRSALAHELGIDPYDLKPDIKIVFADGRQSGAKHIVLRSIKFEEVEAENVEAAILVDSSNDVSLGDGLLGMSFLKNFNFKIDQKENKLILEKIL